MSIFRLAFFLGWALAALAQSDSVFLRGLLPAGATPRAGAESALQEAEILPPTLFEVEQYNSLSGYGPEPLVQVRFSGAVNPSTLAGSVFIVWGEPIGMLSFPTYPQNYVMPVTQVSWDPATNTMYAKPDEPLDMSRRYTILITDSVRDTLGRSIQNATPFFNFSSPLAPLFPGIRLVGGRDFQTMDVTAWVKGIRSTPTGSVRRVLPRVFDLSEAAKITLRSQTAANAAMPLTAVDFPADPDLLVQLGLRRAAFLSYDSPTLSGGVARLHFVVWLPAGPAPAGGYPVVFAGHGLNDSRLGGPTIFATALASNSAVIAINAQGHGFGAASVLRFQLKDGTNLDIPNPGRGNDVDGDGVIGSNEGCVLTSPGQPAFIRDCLRQTAVDYLQLVRELQAGIDADGDGRSDLSPQNVKYIGQSLGAMYGSLFAALEPSLESAVLNVGGSSALETARYSTAFQPLLRQYFALTYPKLVEADGTLADPQSRRYQPVQILTNPRSGPILEALDRALALEADSAPASFAPLLKQGTLVGQPIKRVLYQYALGDQTIPNVANGQLARAGYEYELVSVYRHDIARRLVPSLPADPHIYLAAFGSPEIPALAIGLSALSEASQFLASGKREVPDASLLLRTVFGVNLFERPASLP